MPPSESWTPDQGSGVHGSDGGIGFDEACGTVEAAAWCSLLSYLGFYQLYIYIYI